MQLRTSFSPLRRLIGFLQDFDRRHQILGGGSGRQRPPIAWAVGPRLFLQIDNEPLALGAAQAPLRDTAVDLQMLGNRQYSRTFGHQDIAAEILLGSDGCLAFTASTVAATVSLTLTSAASAMMSANRSRTAS